MALTNLMIRGWRYFKIGKDFIDHDGRLLLMGSWTHYEFVFSGAGDLQHETT